MRTKKNIKRDKFVGLVLVLGLAATAVLAGLALTSFVYAAGVTLTVDRTSDDNDMNPGDGICDVSADVGDQCSLRAALEELNALGPDTTPHKIEFNISGTGPYTVTQNSELPSINVPIVIDGETQPGAACPQSDTPASLQIVLDGSSAGTNVDGLVLNTGSDGSVIRGLVIGNFDDNGILIWSDNNKIGCNHIGIGVDGVSLMSNGSSGVYLLGNENIVGAQSSYKHRNVIAGNFRGITVQGEDNVVRTNLIGPAADGMVAVSNGTGLLGNITGIYITGDNNEIGGSDSAAGNILSGNNGSGLSVNNGANNVILGNFVGVAIDGSTPLPNNYGIQLNGAAVANIVGGIADGEANLIAYNSVNGALTRTNVGGVPVQNQIRGNSIFGNGALGFDIGEDGVDSNDPGDGDSGGNERQNYPVMVPQPNSFNVDVTLDSQANTTYQIDIYRNDSCDDSGNGEGQQYLQTEQAITDGSGLAAFQFLAVGALPNDFLTVTATDPAGNTSEFSACIQLDDVPIVSPTATPDPSQSDAYQIFLPGISK